VAPLARVLPSDRHHRLLNQMRLAKAFLLADAAALRGPLSSVQQVFDADERRLLLGHEPEHFDDCIGRGFAEAQTDDPLRQLMDVDLATSCRTTC